MAAFGKEATYDISSPKAYLNSSKHIYQSRQANQYKARHKCRLFASEFICTFIFTYLGQCALTSFELIGTQNDALTRQLCIILTTGLAYLISLLLSASLSQPKTVPTTLNPSITFAYACFKLIDWSTIPVLLLAQYSGALFAAPIIHATFSDKLTHRHEDGLLNNMNETLRAHGNVLSTGKFFTSFPQTEVTLTQLFISYTLANCFLTLIIASVTIVNVRNSQYFTSSNANTNDDDNDDDDDDEDNSYQSFSARIFSLTQVPPRLRPFYVALGLMLVMAAFCANGSPVINPAQDLSPRLYIAVFGWGASAFNLYRYNYWWLCGIIAPHFGSLIGLSLFNILLCVKHNNQTNYNYYNKQAHYNSSRSQVLRNPQNQVPRIVDPLSPRINQKKIDNQTRLTRAMTSSNKTSHASQLNMK